jgi:lysine 2,3-aminomutase
VPNDKEEVMKTTLRTSKELAARGLIAPGQAEAIDVVVARYAVALPPALAALVDRSDPHDPIARQFVPDVAELAAEANELSDPIGDDTHSPVEGVVHRYPDRVLLKLVNICAVYCRFCFRREMVGPGRPAVLAKDKRDAAFEYIRSHKEIWEVILSGGDPLVISANRLRAVMAALAPIDHVKVIRIHTRLPVAEPARIDANLVRALKVNSKAVYVAVHVNHARELTAEARAACARLVDAGIPMLAQTVLLAGVNDNVQSLGDLMRALVECRIKPYYLHHPDLARGTAHLRTDIASGQALMRALRGRYSGLCQPGYVLDIPGGYGKAPIGPGYVERPATGAADYTIEDYEGRRHSYPPTPRVKPGRSIMTDGQQVEQCGSNRQPGKADKDNGDHSMPHERNVAAQD